MFNRLARSVIVAAAAATMAAPMALADPGPEPAPTGGGPPPTGAVPSADPSVFVTPDGRQLMVSGRNETLLPVAPLTTALSSREYLVGGTFIGAAKGEGATTLTGGTFDVGYRIGCGINADVVDIAGSVGISPSIKIPFTGGDSNYPGINGLVRVHLRPGTVNVVQVDKKAFKGAEARINVAGLRIKVDNCAGQSFIQSYATLSSSTENTEDLTTYLGTVTVV